MRFLQIRQLHAYLGMLIAPTVLFLAATGLLQVYNLHEAHPGYTPPRLIEMLSGIHKDQRLAKGHVDAPDADAHDAGPAAAQAAHPHEHKERSGHMATTLLKAFFTFVAIGLFVSTCLGVWMALRQSIRWRTHFVLLAIGTAVPVVLAALTA